MSTMCQWIFRFSSCVDALGGIDINVEEAENGMDIIPYLNNYVVEVIKNTGVDSAPFTTVRQQHLNGVQANGLCPSQIRRR